MTTTTMLTCEQVVVALGHPMVCNCPDCSQVRTAFTAVSGSVISKLPLRVRGLVAELLRSNGKFTAMFECTLHSDRLAPDTRVLAGFGGICEKCLGCQACPNSAMTNVPMNPLTMAITVAVITLHRGLDAHRLKYRETAQQAEGAKFLYAAYFLCIHYPGE
jgi:hypothetical protein